MLPLSVTSSGSRTGFGLQLLDPHVGVAQVQYLWTCRVIGCAVGKKENPVAVAGEIISNRDLLKGIFPGRLLRMLIKEFFVYLLIDCHDVIHHGLFNVGKTIPCEVYLCRRCRCRVVLRSYDTSSGGAL